MNDDDNKGDNMEKDFTKRPLFQRRVVAAQQTYTVEIDAKKQPVTMRMRGSDDVKPGVIRFTVAGHVVRCLDFTTTRVTVETGIDGTQLVNGWIPGNKPSKRWTTITMHARVDDMPGVLDVYEAAMHEKVVSAVYRNDHGDVFEFDNLISSRWDVNGREVRAEFKVHGVVRTEKA